jgi:hypothetical protein
MNYIGVDYHKKYSYMVVKNEDGRVEGRNTVNNTREEVQQFLEPYRPGMGSSGSNTELGAHLRLVG